MSSQVSSSDFRKLWYVILFLFFVSTVSIIVGIRNMYKGTGYPNKTKPTHHQTYTIGTYLYTDHKDFTLHTSPSCPNIPKGRGLSRLQTSSVTFVYLDYCCPVCISDSIYSKLYSIATHNKKL